MKFHDKSVHLTDDTAVALAYLCAGLYLSLSLALIVRYIANVWSRNLRPLKPSMILLTGFILYTLTRASTMIYSAQRRKIGNRWLVLPTSLYIVLLALMIRLWSLYLEALGIYGERKLPGGAGGCNEASQQPFLRHSTIQQQAPGAAVVVEWREESSAGLCRRPKGYSFTMLLAWIVAVVILVFGIGCHKWDTMRHTHCEDIPSVADVVACCVCGLHILVLSIRMYHARQVDDQATSSNDDGTVTQGQPSRRCCLLYVHSRAVLAAALFGLYSIARGVLIVLNLVGERRATIDDYNEEFIVPVFYIVEWAFLAMCGRLIVGPPHSSQRNSSTQSRSSEHDES